MGFSTNTSGNISSKNSNSSLNIPGYNAHEGFVVACDSTSITLAADASVTDDMYTGCLIEIVSGPAIGTLRKILDYDGSTKIATISYLREKANSSSKYVIHINSGILESQPQNSRKMNVLLPSHFSSIDGFYNISVLKILHNKGTYETRYISSYDGTTKIATLTEPLNEAPEGGDLCVVCGEAGVATDGSNNTITLDGNQSSAVKIGMAIGIYYGTSASDVRIITDIIGNVVTVDRDWTTSADSTSQYCIYSGWAGVYEDVTNYSKIAYTLTFKEEERVMVLSSMSTDGTDANGIHTRREVYDSNKATHTVSAIAKFFRIIVVGTGTSVVGSIQVTRSFNQDKISSTFGDRIDDSSDCNLVRSVVTAKSSDNGRYKNVNVDHRGNLNVNLNDPRDSFGHVMTASSRPIIEMKFPFVTSHYTQDYFFKGSAIFNNAGDNVLTSMTGIPPSTFAPQSTVRFKTLYRCPYSAGLGLSAKFSAYFSEPQPGCHQLIGYGDENDGFFFGYNETNFGILRRCGGKNEVRTVTIDTGATTTGNVTVTLNGLTTDVPVLAGDSAHTVARKLFKGVLVAPYYLQNGYAYTNPGWKTYEDSNSVIFVSQIAGDYDGTFSVSGQGVTGTWVRTQSGVIPTEDWTYIENWNIDRADGTEALPVINFQTGNVYQIDVQWSFGNIDFKILNPKSGTFSSVHELRYPNKYTTPSINNPNQTLCVEADTGVGANFVSVSTACMSVHILGQQNVINGTRIGQSIIKQGSVTKGKKYNIMTLRNDVTLSGKINVMEMFGLTIASSWKGSHAAIFHTIVGAELEIPYSVAINQDGTGYNDGTVQKVTGGTGTGMEIRILDTGSSGQVQEIAIERPGSGYMEQDVVTLLGGSGCTIDVNHVGLTWLPRKVGVSVASYSTDYVEVSGGNSYFSIPLGSDDSFFDKFNDLEIMMPARYSLTLAIEPIADELDAEFSASFFWSEKP